MTEGRSTLLEDDLAKVRIALHALESHEALAVGYVRDPSLSLVDVAYRSGSQSKAPFSEPSSDGLDKRRETTASVKVASDIRRRRPRLTPMPR